MEIRLFPHGDTRALRAVFRLSVHQFARQYYTVEQVHAWAPAEYVSAVGRALVRQPAVRGRAGRLLCGVCNLQPAEPFFRRSGFGVEARQQVKVRGVLLANARMGKALLD